MFSRLLALFSCRHKNLTFPQSPRRGQKRVPAAAATGMYVVCNDCGSEFPYDWETMRALFDEDAYVRANKHALERSLLDPVS
jgi:hypothetical protein